MVCRINTVLKTLCFAFLGITISSSCHPPASAPASANAPAIVYQSSNHEWAATIKEPNQLAHLYIEEAISIEPDGNYRKGASTIADHLGAYHPTSIDSIYTIAEEIAGRDSAFVYEIGGYDLTDGTTYRHLIIKERQEQKSRRVLEFLAPAQLEEAPPANILDAFREQWMQLCNAHNAYELVSQCYTPNALYYNHKPMIVGIDSIAVEYQYMNRSSYSLKLTPLAVEMVSGDLALEIGQCSGSYSGKYVLVWQKMANNTWQLLLDSNI